MQKRKAILLSLLVSVGITLIKFLAYFITGANSALTDALENIVNIIAGGFAFYSIYVSLKPRDSNHPYGHGKVEFFSAFIEGILICTAAIIIIIKVSIDFFSQQEVTKPGMGLLLIGISGLMNMAMGLYLINLGKKENSLALIADGKHLLSDTYTSAGVIISFIIIMLTGFTIADSIISMLISCYILYVGYGLIRRSVAGLMDETDMAIITDVVQLLQSNRRPEWIDIHNLRAQQYGPDLHIDCHVTLPYYFNLTESHAQVQLVEQLVGQNTRGNTELFIHADPCMFECCVYCNMPNCPVRKHAKQTDIPWTLENITKNQKHFING